MVSRLEITGSKEQIVEQIGRTHGRILSATLLIDQPVAEKFIPPTDVELSEMMEELDSLAVRSPNVDYSREAMYTRMPGE